MTERPPEEIAVSVLGLSGRMIAASKSSYRQRYPERAPIFNANVCLLERKIWHGDLDLTVDEPLLLTLADQLGRGIFVLFEHDGRFANEQKPLLWKAAFRAFAGGRSDFNTRLFARGEDGRIQRLRPTAPAEAAGGARQRVRPHDWDGRRRPRLLRFWQLEQMATGNAVTSQLSDAEASPWGSGSRVYQTNHLLYVGERGGPSPLLVLGLFRTLGPRRALGLEFTWYPSRRPYTVHERFKLRRCWQFGKRTISFSLLNWPGFMHELLVRVEWSESRRATADDDT